MLRRFIKPINYDILRVAVALLLLTASVLKCWQLATEPVIGTSLLDSRWLLIATVEFELFFGIWLLANIWAKPTWAAALACFGLFTCVSLCKALSGHATCGCFGHVAVNPWYTTGLDLAVVLSLLRLRPKESFLTIGRATAVLMIWLLIGIPFALAMGSYIPATITHTGGIVGDDTTVLLQPRKWIGQQFPLVDYIDIGHKLKEGKWLVVLYHHDCSKCQEVISGYQRDDMANKDGQANGPNVAFVELPPYGGMQDTIGCREMPYRWGKLDDEREWLVDTPSRLVLENGLVTQYISRQ